MPVLQRGQLLPRSNSAYGVEMKFELTQAGVYSEVFVKIYGQPNGHVSLTLNGPAVTPPAKQTASVEADGSVTFVYKVTRFGTYSVSGEYDVSKSNPDSRFQRLATQSW